MTAETAGAAMSVNGIVTGRIGVGKTTVCQQVIALARQRGHIVHGLLTPAIIGPDGLKVGISITDLSTGRSRTLARIEQDGAGLPVGKYTFDPTVLRWGCAALERAAEGGCDLLLVDEIGPLELLRGQGFVRAAEILEAGILPHTLLVVRESLLEAIRARAGGAPLLEFQVSEQNRDHVAAEIVDRLFARPVAEK